MLRDALTENEVTQCYTPPPPPQQFDWQQLDFGTPPAPLLLLPRSALEPGLAHECCKNLECIHMHMPSLCFLCQALVWSLGNLRQGGATQEWDPLHGRTQLLLINKGRYGRL